MSVPTVFKADNKISGKTTTFGYVCQLKDKMGNVLPCPRWFGYITQNGESVVLDYDEVRILFEDMATLSGKEG